MPVQAFAWPVAFASHGWCFHGWAFEPSPLSLPASKSMYFTESPCSYTNGRGVHSRPPLGSTFACCTCHE